MSQNYFAKIDSLSQEIAAYLPLTRHESKQLKDFYRVWYTYTSNAIEGNSLTETETKIVIEEGITIIPPTLRKDYIDVIKQSQKQKNSSPFINFISAMVYESQKEYLRLVRVLRQE